MALFLLCNGVAVMNINDHISAILSLFSEVLLVLLLVAGCCNRLLGEDAPKGLSENAFLCLVRAPGIASTLCGLCFLSYISIVSLGLSGAGLSAIVCVVCIASGIAIYLFGSGSCDTAF